MPAARSSGEARRAKGATISRDYGAIDAAAQAQDAEQYHAMTHVEGHRGEPLVRIAIRRLNLSTQQFEQDARWVARCEWFMAVRSITLPPRLAELSDGRRGWLDQQQVAETKALYVRAIMGQMRTDDAPRCALLTCPREGVHRIQDHTYCTAHRGLWILAGLRYSNPASALFHRLALKEDGCSDASDPVCLTVARYHLIHEMYWGWAAEHGSDAYDTLARACGTAADPLVRQVLMHFAEPLDRVAADARFLAEYTWAEALAPHADAGLYDAGPYDALLPDGRVPPDPAVLRRVADLRRRYLRDHRPRRVPEPACEALSCWSAGAEFIHHRWYCLRHVGLALLCGLRHTVPECAVFAAVALKGVATYRDDGDAVGVPHAAAAADIGRTIGRYHRLLSLARPVLGAAFMDQLWMSGSLETDPLVKRLMDRLGVADWQLEQDTVRLTQHVWNTAMAHTPLSDDLTPLRQAHALSVTLQQHRGRETMQATRRRPSTGGGVCAVLDDITRAKHEYHRTHPEFAGRRVCAVLPGAPLADLRCRRVGRRPSCFG